MRGALGFGLVGISACAPTVATHPVETPSTLISWPAPGDGYTGGAALWQGFENTWGYNHRINRLGSIVQQGPHGCPSDEASCRVTWTNGAASGTGGDVALVRTYLSLVRARDAAFGSATAAIELHGAEGSRLDASAVVDVPLDEFASAQTTFSAFLNGFDLTALDTADKLVEFELHVGTPTLEGRVVRVPVDVGAQMDCSTPECPRRDSVDYRLTVAVGVIAGSEPAFREQHTPVRTAYSWDRAEELALDRAVIPLEGVGVNPDHAVLAIQGFRLGLEREAHILQVGISVHADPRVDLVFKSWSEGMRREHPPDSLFSNRRSGAVTWEADIVAFTFEDAQITPIVGEGEIEWAGRGRRADTPLATRSGAIVASWPQP